MDEDSVQYFNNLEIDDDELLGASPNLDRYSSVEEGENIKFLSKTSAFNYTLMILVILLWIQKNKFHMLKPVLIKRHIYDIF